MSKSLMSGGDLLRELSEVSELSPGFPWSARFMETAGAPDSFLLRSAHGSVLKIRRISGQRSSIT